MTTYNRFIPLLYQALYEGEGSPGTGGTGTGTSGDPTPKPKLEETPEFKQILQRELNRVNKDANQRNKELVNQLEQLKTNQSLSEEEKNNLQTRIDELTSTFQTKEEQQKIEIDKLTKKHTTELTATSEDRDRYKGLFEQKVLSVEIFEAASEFKAFNPHQISAILLPLTKVAEGLDSDGKPNGEYHGTVNFTGKDKDGKPIQLKLSVKDAVKAMTEMPEQYGNLFKTDANSGLGSSTNGGSTNGGRLADIDSMSPQEYAKNRERILKEVQRAS